MGGIGVCIPKMNKKYENEFIDLHDIVVDVHEGFYKLLTYVGSNIGKCKLVIPKRYSVALDFTFPDYTYDNVGITLKESILQIHAIEEIEIRDDIFEFIPYLVTINKVTVTYGNETTTCYRGQDLEKRWLREYIK